MKRRESAARAVPSRSLPVLPNAGERGGFYAVGFQMSRNSKKNPTRTTIRGSNTQLSVL
jgi:hypothetical protein